jgi:hypothetical protein
MKRQKNAEELAARLTAGAIAPLQTVTPAVEEPAVKETQGSKGKKATVAVFLRLPETLHNHLDAKAIARTKELGRGVSVQQVILEILERDL